MVSSINIFGFITVGQFTLIGPAENDAHKMSDFIAGDDRAMSQPTLLSMHVLLLREHNRVAKRLQSLLKPRGDQPGQDEILFQVMSIIGFFVSKRPIIVVSSNCIY